MAFLSLRMHKSFIVLSLVIFNTHTHTHTQTYTHSCFVFVNTQFAQLGVPRKGWDGVDATHPILAVVNGELLCALPQALELNQEG